MEKPHHARRSLTASSSEESIPTANKQYTLLKYDILTVFQAAPLAYRDSDNNIHPIGMLDFDLEREIVSEALNEARTVDAKIDIVFETATTDRLGAFLAKSESQILHFSCHGHPEYLFVEDGWGAGQQLLVRDLKEWIEAGGSNLRFVFVSACHSRSAGEAFLAAGVPHVVCCRQDSHQLRNTAAVEFARAFYRALACCKTLKEAFELGKKGVQHCPQVEDAYNEMEKFALLPEDADHNEPIFFTKPLPRTFAPKSWCSSRSKMFPVPPQPFVGRYADMYKIMDALRTSRLVRVSGPSGSGKCCLVKAVGQYIFKRNLMDDMFWLPTDDHNRNGNDIVSWLSRLFDEFQSASRAETFRRDKTYKLCRGEILDELHQKKALIIIDARKIMSSDGIRKLTTFLEDLFQATRHTKVIVVHRFDDNIHSKRFSVVEEDVELSPLDYESTVSLFASLCRRGGNSDELYDILCRQHEADSATMSHRTSEIFKMLGNGIPAEINDIAKSMTVSDYKRMMSIARRPAPTAFKTRAALEQKIANLGEEIEIAINNYNFRRAKEIQESLDEMEKQRDCFQDLATLRMMADGVRSDQEQAIFMKNFGEAEELQKQLDMLIAQIKLEEKDSPVKDSLIGGNDETISSVLRGTRASVDAEVRKLENALEEACDNNDFRQARVIDGKLHHLKLRRGKLPSGDQLSMQLLQLKTKLKEAKNDRKWEEAETLHHAIVDFENKLKLERDAETEIYGAAPKQEKDANHQAKMDVAKQTVEKISRGQDPPGSYAGVEEVRGKPEPSRIEPTRQDGSSATNTVRPGAFAVSGLSGTDSEEHDDDISCCGLGDSSEESAEEIHAISEDDKEEAEEKFTAGQKIADLAAIAAEVVENEDKPAVKEILECLEASIPPRLAPQPTFYRQPLVIDGGRVLHAKEAEKYCKRKGLCRLCGKVQTHRRKRFGRKMEPITTTDASGNYAVYKGYCLRQSCYTLVQAKRELGEEQKPQPSHEPLKNKRERSTAKEEDLPVATVVPVSDQEKQGSSTSAANQEAEREKLERLIRDTISSMTVTATKVEVEESAGKTSSQKNGTKEGEESDDKKQEKKPGKKEG